MQSSSAPISVAFCTDVAYVPYMATALVSLLKNNRNANLDIHLVCPPLPQETVARIEKIGVSYQRQLNVHIIDEDAYSDLPTLSYFSKAMYYRFMLPTLLNSEKVIYIDCDTLIEADVRDLWSIDVSNHSCAGVNSISNLHDMQRLGLSEYYNSGVLLLNLEYWRSHDTSRQCIDWLSQHRDAVYPDQDAINSVLKGTILPIAPIWNLNPFSFESFDVLSTISSRILHFYGSLKPWHLYYDFDVQRIYRSYIDSTDWGPDFLPQRPQNDLHALIVGNQFYERSDFENASKYYIECIQMRLRETPLSQELHRGILNIGIELHNEGQWKWSSAIFRAYFKHLNMKIDHIYNIFLYAS